MKEDVMGKTKSTAKPQAPQGKSPHALTPDGSLNPLQVEELFHKATLVAYSLAGLHTTVMENVAPESLAQELFAIWETAHSMHRTLAKAYCGGLEPAPAGGGR
jgi:hypothetical protein